MGVDPFGIQQHIVAPPHNFNAQPESLGRGQIKVPAEQRCCSVFQTERVQPSSRLTDETG